VCGASFILFFNIGPTISLLLFIDLVQHEHDTRSGKQEFTIYCLDFASSSSRASILPLLFFFYLQLVKMAKRTTKATHQFVSPNSKFDFFENVSTYRWYPVPSTQSCNRIQNLNYFEIVSACLYRSTHYPVPSRVPEFKI
jgi:hypothetical protein